eukprot:1763078-Rhodomonas_salina.1
MDELSSFSEGKPTQFRVFVVPEIASKTFKAGKGKAGRGVQQRLFWAADFTAGYSLDIHSLSTRCTRVVVSRLRLCSAAKNDDALTRRYHDMEEDRLVHVAE